MKVKLPPKGSDLIQTGDLRAGEALLREDRMWVYYRTEGGTLVAFPTEENSLSSKHGVCSTSTIERGHRVNLIITVEYR